MPRLLSSVSLRLHRSRASVALAASPVVADLVVLVPLELVRQEDNTYLR